MNIKPDRSDYEIWLIDWIDGKLDQAGIDKMIQFLNENPDLKEEVDFLSQSLPAAKPVEYSNKELLRKTARQLPESQIELLSVASLENDITPEQKEDLEENLNTNSDNRRVYESIMKIRLFPDHKIGFEGKKALLHGSVLNRDVRIAATWMSAAAAIALLIISSFLFRGKVEENNLSIITSQIKDPVQAIPEPAIVKVTPETPTEIISQGFEPKQLKRISEDKTAKLQTPIVTDETGLSTEPARMQTEEPSMVPVALPSIAENSQMNNLIILSVIQLYEEPQDDGRSKLEKFIAKNFREVLLKEEVPADSKLKSYEFAEAGIEGLNRLLGWEMTLVKNNDEEGDVQSVSFNSKLLKFNTPVRNEESTVTF